MDDNIRGLFDLPDECIAKIMKYIISDCELRFSGKDNQLQYGNLVNFALAHERITEVLKQYYKALYQRVEFLVMAGSRYLKINFTWYPSGRGRDLFWRLYGEAVRANNVLELIVLSFDPIWHDPQFLDQFQMIKRALENKRSLKTVEITLRGYSVESLSNFNHLSHLNLDARMSAETLVSVCMSNPQLTILKVKSNEMYGRLSDIVPHCRNLKELEFMPKLDNDFVEYEPLAKLPKLERMSIYNAFQNGWLLPMLQAMLKAAEKWKRPRFQRFTLSFSDMLPCPGTVTLPGMQVMETLTYRTDSPWKEVALEATYNIFGISKDSSLLTESLVTIRLTNGLYFSISRAMRKLELRKGRTSDKCDLLVLLKLFNVHSLEMTKYDGDLADFFKSIMAEISVKLLNMRRDVINLTAVVELVKIKSIRCLVCTFSDCESVEPLSELKNLQYLNITVQDEFRVRHLPTLSGVIRTCQVEARVEFKYWNIVFRKNEKALEFLNINCEPNLLIPLAQIGGINSLTVSGFNGGSLNELIEAFAAEDLNVIEKVYVSGFDFNDIHKVAEVQSIKYLQLFLSRDTSGIEKLSELTGLEELDISPTDEGSLDKLFHQLATKKSPSLQCLQVAGRNLFSEECVNISRIKSLKKLRFEGLDPEDNASLTELAKSNIEYLSITIYPHLSLNNLFAAFAKQNPSRLQTLQVKGKNNNDRMELSLKTCHTWSLDSVNVVSLLESDNLVSHTISCEYVGFKLSLQAVKNVVVWPPVGLTACEHLAGLEHLESLTVLWSDLNLSTPQRFREIEMYPTEDLLWLYQAFACRRESRLKHLSVPIRYVEELSEVTRIRSLQKLHLRFKKGWKTVTDLGQLTELKELSLDIELKEIEYVLALLTSCINLDILTIKYETYEEEHFMREVQNHLRSIRDPAVRGPLKLNLHRTDTAPSFHVDDVDETYLTVNHVYNKSNEVLQRHYVHNKNVLQMDYLR